MLLHRGPRSGTTAVECALTYPAVFLFTLGLVVGAAGVFRYQELASLSRRAARYAATHGWKYAKDTGLTAPAPSDIYNNVIVPNAVGLDLSQLSYSITYGSGSNSQYQATVVNGKLTVTTNTVTVTLTYKWVPEAFAGGITLTSTSVMPMSY
jgi:hypothetical protein